MNNSAGSNISEILSGYLMNERLDNILLDDPEYIKILESIDQATVCFECLKLSEGQCMIVDNLISVYTAYGVYYARMAYQQGMKDCVRMLREIGVVYYMRKLKVYLDTSVVSYLKQEDAPERMKDTLELWKDFVNGK